MVATAVTEFVVIQLIYLPLMQTEDRRRILSRRRIRPSGSALPVRQWYNRIIRKERSKVRPGTFVRQIQCRIFSGNKDLFEIDGCIFDQIYLILAEQFSHWVFFMRDPDHRRVEGNGVLPCSYCACCILSQYEMILKAIKSFKQTS